MMKISELSRISGIPISTIKYYADVKLLPPPIKAGKTISYYTNEHLTRLKLIEVMKADKLSIKMIKDVLEHQSADDNNHYDRQKIHPVKREVILNAAIIVFRAKGYSGSTISDIVSEAGIGRNTFYVYFKNKEELFFECADDIFDDLDSSIPELNNEPDLLIRLKMRLKHVFENPHLIDMLNLIKGSSVNNVSFKKKFTEIVRAYGKPIQKELDRGYKQGLFKKVDYTLFGYLIMGLVEYGFHFCHSQEHASFNDFSDIFIDFLQNGLKN